MAGSKSTVIQNIEATKQVFNRVSHGGRLRAKATGPTTLAISGSTIGDVHRLLRFHSGDVIWFMMLYTNGAAAAGAADVGVYLANDGAVVDVDYYSQALAISTASTNSLLSNQLFGTGSSYSPYVANEAFYPMYLGLGRGTGSGSDVDPLEEYDIALTLTTALTTTNTIVNLMVWYTAGD